MAQDLAIVRGTSNVFGIEVTNINGEPFVLEEGQVLVFAIKKRPKDEDRILVKTITHSIDTGTFYLELFPSDTEDVEPGKYVYDVGLQHGNSVFFNVIEASTFEIKPNVTKCGDGC